MADIRLNLFSTSATGINTFAALITALGTKGFEANGTFMVSNTVYGVKGLWNDNGKLHLELVDFAAGTLNNSFDVLDTYNFAVADLLVSAL